jgi:hypothetical protein
MRPRKNNLTLEQEFPIGLSVSKYLKTIEYDVIQNGKSKLRVLKLECVCGKQFSTRRVHFTEFGSCGCKKGEAAKEKLSSTVDGINTRLPNGIKCLEILDTGKCLFLHEDSKKTFISRLCNVRKGSNPIDGAIKRKLTADKNKISEEKMRSYLDENTDLDYSTYKSARTNMKFIDKEYGEWWAKPLNVIRGSVHPKRAPDIKLERMKETSRAKYGVDFSAQNKDVALKTAKTLASTYIAYHWDSNEELICQGSWELKVVEFLNKNQINFLWQPQVFTMPSGATYRPDLFLIDDNLWVEIKGYWRGKSKAKYEWFHSVYPNSEVWMSKELKNKGIL